MPQIDRPRGTRDFRPEEMEKRRWLERVFRDTFHRYGYREIQTPAFEHTELFTTKSGEGVLRQIYEFKDKGDRSLTLRPELTAAVMRFYVNELTHEPKPLKLYYYGPCYRYEEPQSGRYREFWQFGLELLGAEGAEADAEVIAVAYHALREAGLTRFNLHVGHVGILRDLLRDLPIPEEKRNELWKKIDKDETDVRDFLEGLGVEARLAEAVAGLAEHQRRLVLGDEEGAPRAVEEFFEDARNLVKGAVDEALAQRIEAAISRLENTLKVLESYGVRDLHVDLGVVRGLDYYTGVVFEFEAPDLGAEKQIGGGGAYTLAQLFGGEETGSVGFGLGFDRILIALEKEGKIPDVEHQLDAYLVPVGDIARISAFEIAADLRAKGLRVDVDLMDRKIGKAMKYADRVGARHAMILGERELDAGTVALKNLKTGDQRQVKLAELADVLRTEG